MKFVLEKGGCDPETTSCTSPTGRWMEFLFWRKVDATSGCTRRPTPRNRGRVPVLEEGGCDLYERGDRDEVLGKGGCDRALISPEWQDGIPVLGEKWMRRAVHLQHPALAGEVGLLFWEMVDAIRSSPFAFANLFWEGRMRSETHLVTSKLSTRCKNATAAGTIFR